MSKQVILLISCLVDFGGTIKDIYVIKDSLFFTCFKYIILFFLALIFIVNGHL